MNERHKGGVKVTMQFCVGVFFVSEKRVKNTDYFASITLNASVKIIKSYEHFPSHTQSPIPWSLNPPLGYTGSLIERPSGQRL